MEQHLFRNWKWNFLANERQYLVPSFNCILSLVWFNIYLDYSHIYEFSKPSSNHVLLWTALPLFFAIYHACIPILAINPWTNSQPFSKFQLMRICEWCLVSVLVAAWYLLMPRYIPESENMGDISLMTAPFQCLVLMGIICVHYLSYEEIASLVYLAILFIFIIMYFIVQAADFMSCLVLVTSALLCTFVVYQQGQQLEGNHRIHGEDNPDTVARSVPDSLKTINLVMSVVKKIDLILVESSEPSDVPGLGPLGGALSVHEAGRVDNVKRYIRLLGTLKTLKCMCDAITVVSHKCTGVGNDNKIGEEDSPIFEFGFMEMCINVFSVFEHRVGHALPLYYDDDTAEAFFQGPLINQKLCELILFLIFYVSAVGIHRSICYTDCFLKADSGQPKRWFVRFRIICPSESKTSWRKKDAKADSSTSSSSAKPPSAEPKSPIEEACETNDNFEKLAEAITKELNSNSNIAFLTIEEMSGMSIYTRQIDLPQEMAHSNDGYRSLLSTSSTRQRWLMVQHHTNNLDGLNEIVNHLAKLYVPVTLLPAYEIGSANGNGMQQQQQFAIAVIYENLLPKLSTQLLQIISSCAVAMIVVVEKKISVSALQKKYGIICDRTLSKQATLIDVFNCVMDVTSRQPARSSGSVASRLIGLSRSPAHKLPEEEKTAEENIYSKFEHILHRVELCVRQASPRSRKSSSPSILADTSHRGEPFNSLSDDSLIASSVHVCRSRIRSLKKMNWSKIATALATDSNRKGGIWTASLQHCKTVAATRKWETRYIIEKFHKHSTNLRTLVHTSELETCKVEVASLCVDSSELQLGHLNCWYTILHEIIDLFLRHVVVKPSPRPPGGFSTESTTTTTTSNVSDFDVDSREGSAKTQATVDGTLPQWKAILMDYIDAIDVAIWDTALSQLQPVG